MRRAAIPVCAPVGDGGAVVPFYVAFGFRRGRVRRGDTVAAGRWGSGWVHVKLCLGLMLLAYQLYCGVLLRRFQDYSNAFSHRWYRVFNEIPVLLMVAALYLVVFKPF